MGRTRLFLTVFDSVIYMAAGNKKPIIVIEVQNLRIIKQNMHSSEKARLIE